MSGEAERELRARIDGFEFDEPGATLTFASRLARENGWSIGFAQRAIAEYRRFLFLAFTAGHPVTPSDAVDQVWHLHLTYTRSYWQRLCREVLRGPLHHEPTRGGREEGTKFADWYERTLAAYQRAFDEVPPPDVWPPAEVRFGTDLAHVRVNRAECWLVPRPTGWRHWLRRGRLAGLGLAGAATAGCAALFHTPPFTLNGSAFLTFFPIFAVIVFAFAAWLRWALSGPGAAPVSDADGAEPDPYLIAFLAGDHARAVQAAVVSLVAAKSAKELAGNGTLVTGRAPLTSTHPLERAVHAALDSHSGQTIRDLALATKGLGDVLRNNLRQRGWWLTTSASARATLVPLALAMVVPLVGGLRSWQGISTDHPTGFILFGTIATAVIALVAFARPAGRTRAGSTALAGFRSRHRELRRMSRLPSPTAEAAGMAVWPLAVGLFGSSVLAGTELVDLRRVLRPADSGGSGCSTSSGCGTGGGGDGGGGGGGCGGCGGGGGD